MSKTNGVPAQEPSEQEVLTVWWDNDKQTFRYQLKNVKNVEFGLAVLGLVQDDMKFNLNLQRANKLEKEAQEKAIQQFQEQAIAAQLASKNLTLGK